MRVNVPKVVLFLHAFPLSSEMYEAQFCLLESLNIPYVAIDYPGFGGRRPYPAQLSIELLTDLIVEDLTDLGVKRIIAVGDSMGGYIMFDLFRRYRDLVEGFVFVATRAEGETPESKKQRYELAEKVEKEGKEFLIDVMIENQTSPETKKNENKIRKLRSIMEKASKRGIANMLRALAERRDNTDLLPHIDVPTVVIAGKDDEKVTPPSVVKKIAEGIKGSEYYELERSAHLPPFENPEDFNKILEKFLKRVF